MAGAPLTRPPRSGEEKLRAAIDRRRQVTRQDDPEPYDPDWGWWINKRLARLETSLKWLVGLAAATLAAEVIRILLASLNLP
jgi:hypothetical protein